MRKINFAVFTLIGAIIVLLGARSGGMFIFVSGILGYYLSSSKNISIKSSKNTMK